MGLKSIKARSTMKTFEQKKRDRLEPIGCHKRVALNITKNLGIKPKSKMKKK
jgi:hypothetical protein